MGGGTEFASKDLEAYSNFDTAPETVTLGLEEYNQVSIWHLLAIICFTWQFVSMYLLLLVQIFSL